MTIGKRVFVLEDDQNTCEVYQEMLEAIGIHQVSVASSVKDARKICRRLKFDLMLMDVYLPDGSGIDFLSAIRSKNIRTPAIVISGNLDREKVLISRDLGVVCSIRKPFKIKTLQKIAETILGQEKNVLSLNEKEQFVHIENALDGSTKYVAFDREKSIEFASLNEERLRRHTICLSSQYGCKMGCGFCATGTQLFRHVSNVRWQDMLAKVSIAQLYYGYEYQEKEIVLAGEGEPTLNISNILKLHGKLGNEFKFRMSTVGLLNTLPKVVDNFANILKELQISLHFPDDELRMLHMPSAKSNPLREILFWGVKFAEKSGKKVKLNVTLFEGINDDPLLAEKLGKRIKGRPFLVQISKANPYGIYRSAEEYATDRYEEIVRGYGVETKRFKSLGRESGVSIPCGQMAAAIGDHDSNQPSCA